MRQREIIVDMGKAAFVVLAFKVMATTSRLIPWNSLADNLCIVFALGVMLVKLWTLTLPLPKLITLAAVSLFVLYTCVSMKQYDLLITVIVICLLIHEDVDEYIRILFRTQSMLIAAHIVIALCLSLSGKDRLFWAVSDSRLRFNGGFHHANVLSSYVMSCMLMFVWLRFQNITANEWGAMAAVTVLSYAMTRTRTGLLMNIMLLLLVYAAQRDQKPLEKLIQPVLFLLFPALAALFSWAQEQYLNNHSLTVLLDDLLTGRIKYAAYAFVRSGRTWLPRFLDYAEEGTVAWNPEWNLNTFTFDNVYSFMFMQMGMVWIAVVSVIVAIVCLKSDFKVKVFILVWILYAMVEVHGLNCFKFFPLLLLSTLFSRKEAPDGPDSQD